MLEDSCWSVGIVFTLKKRAVGNVTMSQGMQGKVGVIKCQICILNPGHGS